MGDNPCTWAPTIVNGKMTWPGCDEHKGLAQTDAGFFGEIESDLEDMFAQVDAEAEASAESFGDGYNGGAFGGFAQIQSGSASGSAHSDSGETDHDTGFFGRMEGDLEDLFAQTGGISVTPQEEKLGMAIGNDALGMAAANHKITPQEAQLGDAGIDLGVEALSGLASHFFSQTDADFGFGDIEAALGGMFAQTGGITVTPQEEKLGMAVGNDALGMAAANHKITPQEAQLGDAGIDLGVEALSGLASHFFSQTDAGFDFGDIEADLGGMFAQTGGITVTPQEEKLGMAVGNDALGMAAASGKITPQEAKLGDAGIDLGVEALSGLASHFFSQTEEWA